MTASEPGYPPAAWHPATVVAAAAVVYAVSLTLHEAAHALTGWVAGGTPTLLTSTDVRGDWSRVSAAGYTAIGVSGSLTNWGLAAIGAWVGARPHLSAATRWAAWLLLAVNGFIPSMYMIVSPLLGFGDWNTILTRWPGEPAWRAIVAAGGVGLTAIWIRVSARRLAELVGPVRGAARAELTGRLTATAWATGGTVGVAAALVSPLDPLWAVGIGLGSTLGTTWPLLPVGASAAERVPIGNRPGARGVPLHSGWVVAGVMAAAIFIGVIGPGVPLD